MNGRSLSVVAALLSFKLSAQVPESCYRVETLPTPEGIAPEVSAIAFTGDGRLHACFQRGTIWHLEPRTIKWKLFASGLQMPLGILPGEAGEFFVAQMPELTRVADTDGDGEADLYETICDAWGMSGNYHEFLAGPLRDADGNFYIALGCASSGGPLRMPVRGAYTQRSRKGEMYGHYSPVPYRGWAVKISPRGEMTPIAAGFRQPNGIAFNTEGDLFAVDNQGDWVGTSPLHHVTPGAFHGHPASLVWDPATRTAPPDIPREELRRRRKPPAVLLPQNDMAGSIAQPLLDTTGGKFGPYAGQMFIAEWSHPRLHRVALEKVGGEYQGACFPFIDGNGLRRGGNRLAFSPRGELYVAQTSRVWGGTGDGLQRIVWTGDVPMDILTMRLAPDGFTLTFTKPVAASSVDTEVFSLLHYRYLYHPQYGSPKTDVTPVAVRHVTIEDGGRRLRLKVDPIVAGRLYEFRCRGVTSKGGEPLVTRLAAYTVNRLKE